MPSPPGFEDFFLFSYEKSKSPKSIALFTLFIGGVFNKSKKENMIGIGGILYYLNSLKTKMIAFYWLIEHKSIYLQNASII